MFKPVRFFHLLFLLVLVSVLLGTVTGCSSFTFLQKAEDAIISGAQKYCKEPQANRSTLRQAVNQGLAGTATVCVQCKGDAPSPECVAPQ
jgi:hypothetical protein